MNIKNGLHNLKHNRPQWYTEYHQWEHHATLHWATFIVSTLVILMGFMNVVMQLTQNTTVKSANAASTILTQDITAGSLTLSNSGDESLDPASVSTSDQDTTGSLGTITVTDNRGTGTGWNATVSSTHFIKYNAAVMTGGANATVSVDSTSTYSSDVQGTYTITITSGGAAGVATFGVSGLETASGTTGQNVAIGTRGLIVDFAAATYTTSDAWTIRVDVIPVTGLEVTPGSLTTIAGSASNVTAGSVHTFSGISDPTAIITAASGYGLGSYSVTPDLVLTIPGNSYANSYTATVVETVL